MPIGAVAGAEYVANTGDAATRDCAIPAGTADGDLLIAYAVLSQDDAAATGITAPGFVEYPFAQATSIGRTAVLARRWNTGDPTSFTFSKSGSASAGTFAVVMIKVPGAEWSSGAGFAVAPAKTDQAAASTAVNCPAATIPAGLPDNALVVRFYHTYYFSAAKNSTDIWTPPSGFTEQADQSDDWCSIGAATLLRGSGTQAAAAATAGGSTAGALGRGISLVVAPAAVATSRPRPIQRPHRAAAARAANF